MKKLLMLLAIVPVMLMAVSPEDIARNSYLEQILKRGELRVGLNAGYAPFEMVAKDGSIIGFDIDLVKLMAKEMGVKLKIVNTDWDGIIPALNTGKFDIIASGMTITLKRALAVNFSDPYFKTGQAILVNKKGKAAHIKSYKDLGDGSGYVIAIQTGTTGDFAATKMFPKAKFKRYEKEVEAAMAVTQGKADLMVFDQPFLAIWAGRHKDKVRAILEPFTYEYFGFAIRKGDVDFLRWINTFIYQIKHDGPPGQTTYDRLFKKWFVDMPWLEKVKD